jgi:hypothetical protein
LGTFDCEKEASDMYEIVFPAKDLLAAELAQLEDRKEQLSFFRGFIDGLHALLVS